jgi:3-phosphoshikimate 1-carboxyvinyltransferase
LPLENKHTQDIEYMLQALKTLGIDLKETAPKQWTVPGRGAPFDTDKPLELFLGNAGTAMRPLTAALCAGKGQVRRWDPPTIEGL